MANILGVSVPTLDWSAADLYQEFLDFEQYCELVFQGPFSDKSGQEKVNYILLWIGKRGVKEFNSWNDLAERQKKDPTMIFKKFREFFQPKSNFRVERFKFELIKQEEEDVDSFIQRVRTQAEKCRFPNMFKTEMIITRLITGVKSQNLQKKLLQKDEDLTLDDTIRILHADEATNRQVEELQSALKVSEVKHDRRRENQNQKRCWACLKSHERSQPCPAKNSTCVVCKKKGHWKGSRFCRNKRINEITEEKDETDQEDLLLDEITFHEVKFEEVKHDLRSEIFADVKIQDRPIRIRAKVDTGAAGNLIPVRIFERLCEAGVVTEKDLKKSNTTLRSYTGEKIVQKGRIALPLQYGVEKVKADFFVCQTEGTPILGLKTSQELKLVVINVQAIRVEETDKTKKKETVKRSVTVKETDKRSVTVKETDKRSVTVKETDKKPVEETDKTKDLDEAAEDMVELKEKFKEEIEKKETVKIYDCKIKGIQHLKDMYPDRFSGLGNFKEPYKIEIRNDAQPVIHPPRKCPIQLRPEIEKQLEEMELLGVIEKVIKPTDWVNSLTYVRKANGKLRVCLDPKDLNKAIRRCHYVTPTLEEITHRFAGSKVFSKLDAKNGFWSVHLEEKSSFFTTFNSPKGRYRFKRMPFGLTMSSDVFQFRMDRITEGTEAVAIADDIGIHGPTKEIHDERLHNLMKKAREEGLVFNADKCTIGVDEIPFFGQIYSAKGVSPDPERVKAIADLKPPENLKDLQHFLGIANYMNSHVEHMAHLTKQLRRLTHKDVEFKWTEQEEEQRKMILEEIKKSTLLNYFDPNQLPIITVDASMLGLGATLRQEKGVVAFASRTLTDTESRYANIEREMLAVVFGVEHFKNYIYGKPFVVESDHKPLEMIVLKNLHKVPIRLQRMILKLQPFDMKIVYVPGKDIPVPDALSRLKKQEESETDCADKLETDVTDITDSATDKVDAIVTDSSWKRAVREETQKDDQLKKLADVIKEGFPDKTTELHKDLRIFWSVRDLLTVQDGIILKGVQAVIPETLRRKALEKLHFPHLGVNNTIKRAGISMWWPGFRADVQSFIKRCDTCQEVGNANRQQPAMMHEIPTRIWQKIGTDLFQIGADFYIAVVDYRSKFVFVKGFKQCPSASQVIKYLKVLFSEHGIPEVVVSDNGPQFREEFKMFAESYGFTHSPASPYWPKGNGQIERAIQTIKNILKKNQQKQAEALLEWRNTPMEEGLPSPSELFFGRKIRGNIPVFVAEHPRQDLITEHLKKKQEEAEKYLNRGTREMKVLSREQKVWIKSTTKKGAWFKGKVIRKSDTNPEQYLLDVGGGRVLARNRAHLKEREEEEV